MTRADRWGVAFAALALVAGCRSGGDDGAAASSTTTTTRPVAVDPCSLVGDEAVAVLADGLEPGVADDLAGPHTCAWRNGNGLAVVNVRVAAVGEEGLAEELARSALAGDRFVEVRGVGDEAVAVFRGRRSAGLEPELVEVLARRGDLVAVVGTPGLGITSEADPGYAAAIDLLRQAIGALP